MLELPNIFGYFAIFFRKYVWLFLLEKTILFSQTDINNPEYKWRTAMFQNISTFERISISPEDSLASDVEIAILVITRWNDNGSRMFLRNTLGFTKKVRGRKSWLTICFVYLFRIKENDISGSETIVLNDWMWYCTACFITFY